MAIERSAIPASGLPLIFTHSGVVIGEGFVARVSLRGRVIAENIDDGVFIAGIIPGSVATDKPAQTLNEAGAYFSEVLKQVLIDIARDAGDADAFRAEIEKLAEETSQTLSNTWEEALEGLAKAKLTSLQLGLPVLPSGAVPYARVEIINPAKPTPDMNASPSQPVLSVPKAA